VKAAEGYKVPLLVLLALERRGEELPLAVFIMVTPLFVLTNKSSRECRAMSCQIIIMIVRDVAKVQNTVPVASYRAVVTVIIMITS
jgi:hypothetical protein